MEPDQLIVSLRREVRRGVTGMHEHSGARRVLLGQASSHEYATYLRTAYVAVEQAPSLLRASSDAVRDQGGPDALADLLASKVAEESGHREWLRDDLGFIKQPEHGPTTRAGQAYVNMSRELIALCGASFLGTAYVLESFSVECAGEAARNLTASGVIAGLRPGSRQGVTFFSAHFDADVGHIEALEKVIRAAADARAASYMLLAARMTATLYADFFG